MREKRLRLTAIASIVGLSLLSLGMGLSRSGRLTYHEAITAQSAREMLSSGNVLIPTLDQRPWLEKPPLIIWLVALGGYLTGQVNAAEARFPACVAGALLGVGVGALASRRFGRSVGLFAGLVQVTTAWTVMRGRLAEGDILLACLFTWTINAFDRLRTAANDLRSGTEDSESVQGRWFNPGQTSSALSRIRWEFFILLGTTSLAKGIGFGAILIVAVLTVTLAWDRDWRTLRVLLFPAGWVLSAGLALAWPCLVWARYPEVWSLWSLHIVDRLSARSLHFAGEPWWEYMLGPFWQTLPWSPLAVVAGIRSLRAVPHRRERVLWVWAIIPAALVSLASTRNAHYLIYALPPWSIAAALGLTRLEQRLRHRGWKQTKVRQRMMVGFLTAGCMYGLGFAFLGPFFDRRGSEWGFYEQAGALLPRQEPMVLFYDDWDGRLYPTPFGAVPHDLAVRLFYLNRPATWCQGIESLRRSGPKAPLSYGIIARERDLEDLKRLGSVELLASGPTTRPDRTYLLYRVRPVTQVHEALRRAGRSQQATASSADGQDRVTQ